MLSGGIDTNSYVGRPTADACGGGGLGPCAVRTVEPRPIPSGPCGGGGLGPRALRYYGRGENVYIPPQEDHLKNLPIVLLNKYHQLVLNQTTVIDEARIKKDAVSYQRAQKAVDTLLGFYKNYNNNVVNADIEAAFGKLADSRTESDRTISDYVYRRSIETWGELKLNADILVHHYLQIIDEARTQKTADSFQQMRYAVDALVNLFKDARDQRMQQTETTLGVALYNLTDPTIERNRLIRDYAYGRLVTVFGEQNLNPTIVAKYREQKQRFEKRQ